MFSINNVTAEAVSFTYLDVVRHLAPHASLNETDDSNLLKAMRLQLKQPNKLSISITTGVGPLIGSGALLTNLPAGQLVGVLPALNGSALTSINALLYNGQAPSFYLNYANLTGKPTIPTNLPPIGLAGGDLGGSYPNPTVPSKFKAQLFTPVSGGTVTAVYSGYNIVIELNPAGTLASLNLTAPGGVPDNGIFTVTSTQAITNLTVVTTGGATVSGPISQLAAGAFASYIYNLSLNKWFRIG